MVSVYVKSKKTLILRGTKMNFIKKILPIILLFLLLGSYPLLARNKAVKIKVGAGKAVVTLLEGDASLFKKGVTKPKALSKKSLLTQGDRVTTGTRSRIEIKLPEKSLITGFRVRKSWSDKSGRYPLLHRHAASRAVRSPLCSGSSLMCRTGGRSTAWRDRSSNRFHLSTGRCFQ
jgi:hypothetical protein